jgi:hypothetical protein
VTLPPCPGAAPDGRLAYDPVIAAPPDSGVTRIPDHDPTIERFYLIVEAIGAGGKPIPRLIRSEEDDSERCVTIWGLRVREDVWEAVAADKGDDGEIDAPILGRKAAANAAIVWKRPVLGGMITEW